MPGTQIRAASWTALAGLLLLGNMAGAQQSDQDWLERCERQADRSERAVFCEVRPVSLRLIDGGLAVDAGRNGGVTVWGGEVSEAQVSARLQAYAESSARARAIAQGIRIHAAAGRVSADGPDTAARESWSVSYAVTVPNRADLDLSAVNGPISVRDVSGRIRAETRNGPLALDGLAGDVRGRTTNGPLTVKLSGSRWDGAGMDAETRNGPLTLEVPEDYSAALETGTVRGPLSVGFPITVTLSGRRTDRISTTLGSGGAPVRVVTTNGPATVRHRSGQH
jgi:DUF4097 and DUF4098 domain-containing protein YvlB